MIKDVTLTIRGHRMQRNLTRALEGALWGCGLVTVGFVLWSWSSSYFAQSRGAAELSELIDLQAESSSPTKTLNPAALALREGDLVGDISIPRLGMNTVIFEGTSAHTLHDGVGHLSSSALPAQSGNVVLAAHRDTFFRPLKDVQQGDWVTVRTPAGSAQYKVFATQVVDPSAVELVAPTEEPILTLVTCYPFYYVGHAPQRFIVRAKKIG